jgi:hypothetical protein
MATQMIRQRPINLGAGATIAPRYLTRHIGIFGATGTGKTTSATSIVKQLACPVIVLDAKGDLGGLGDVVAPWEGAQMNVARLGCDLMCRALGLSEAQSGALDIALAWAEDSGQACATLTDLRAVLNRMGYADLSNYGLVSLQSVAAVQRAILRFQRAAPWAFGSNEFDPFKWQAGRTIIHAPDLVAVHGLYATFAARLLEQVYQGLDELGDAGAPGLAILIDEAHLLFQDAPMAVTRRLEQIVRLIRSKGVCLIFVSQAPSDLPSAILGQLATRVQHGLRAGTQAQQAAARAAAETMPGDVTAAMILDLAMGEALLSTPDAQGKPIPAFLVKVQPVSIPNRVFSDVPPSDHSPKRVDISPTGPRFDLIPPNPCIPVVQPTKRRAWYFWPLILASVLYGPMIVFG